MPSETSRIPAKDMLADRNADQSLRDLEHDPKALLMLCAQQQQVIIAMRHALVTARGAILQNTAVSGDHIERGMKWLRTAPYEKHAGEKEGVVYISALAQRMRSILSLLASFVLLYGLYQYMLRSIKKISFDVVIRMCLSQRSGGWRDFVYGAVFAVAFGIVVGILLLDQMN